MNIVKNDIFDYESRHIYQFEKGYKFSLDSILLAEYTKTKINEKNIVDLCTGNAVIPLILSKYTRNVIHGIELNKEAYKLGQKSLVINNLEKQINLINDDIKNALNYLEEGSIDVISCNPPYYKNDLTNQDVSKTISRHEKELTLEEVFKISSKLLKHKGCLFISHRVNRLDEIMSIGETFNLRVKEVMLIDTKNNFKPESLLVKCVKGSKSGIKILLKQIKNLKTYQDIFKEEK